MSLLYGPLPQQVATTYASTEPQPAFYCVGVDLGSVSDSTAITVLEASTAFTVEMQHTKFSPTPQEAKRTSELHGIVRLVHRPRLGVSYPAIIDQVASIMVDLPPMKEEPILAADATGLGAPILQQMRTVGLKPIGVTITAGNNASLVGRDWSCPKALLVGELRLALHQKRLKVAQGFAAREVLAEELAAFTARVSASGRASFEAAGDEHDDTVLSLALAWFAAKNRPVPAKWVNINIMRR